MLSAKIFGLRAMLFLFLGLLFSASGLNLGRSASSDLSSTNLFGRVDPNTEFLSCQSSCAPLVNRDNAPKQEVWGRRAEAADDTSPALSLRDMTLPNGDMETFMLKQVPQAKPVVWSIDRNTDLNTAVSKKFADSRRPFSYSLQGLCGCTSVWIISRTGMYASHFWESISFSPDNVWRAFESEPNSQLFERTVIEPIKNGKIHANGRTEQEKVALDMLGNDDSVRAYIVRPDKSCNDDMMDVYESYWDQIKATIGAIIPALDPEHDKDLPTDSPDRRWKAVIYNALDMNDPKLDTTSAGKVLFKYDPNHKGKKKATLWVESRETPWHDDEW